MPIMNSDGPTSIKARSLVPEYASKIIEDLLLQGLRESDLMRLVPGPETVRQSLIMEVKDRMGLPSNALSEPSTPPSRSTLNPISRPSMNGHTVNPNGFMNIRRRNASFPASNTWSLSRAKSNENGYIGTKSSRFLSFDSIQSAFHQHRDGSVPNSVVEVDSSADLPCEQQLSGCLSFLDDSPSKSNEFVDSRVPLDYPMNNGDIHLHKRSFSASDACFGYDDGGFGFADDVDWKALTVDWSSKLDGFHRQNEETMRMKLVYQQKLAAAHFFARSPQPYERRMDMLLHPQGLSRVGAFPFSDERNRCRKPSRLERNDFFGMSFGDRSNSASKQIYMTFPADSSFKKEDVANYFSQFGAVDNVRIPYQQKRMYGFVSFFHSKTVKLVLARGNPHFIYHSRVLVKPYKEKGKVSDRKQHHHLLQQTEGGSFSPRSNPRGIDPRESCDFHPLEKVFYDAQERMELQKEDADLEREIELEKMKLMNLDLLEYKNKSTQNHQRSLSIGSPGYLSSFINQISIIPTENLNQEGSEGRLYPIDSTVLNKTVNDGNTEIGTLAPTPAIAEPHLQADTNLITINHSDYNGEKSDSQECSDIKLVLPDTLLTFTKVGDNHQSCVCTEAGTENVELLSGTNGDSPESPATSSPPLC